MRSSFLKTLVVLLLMLAITPLHAAIVASGAGTTYSNASGTVTSFTLNRPANVNAGDILFVQISMSANVSASPTVLSGSWTLLDDDVITTSNNVIRQQIYSRTAVAGVDTANSSTTWNLSNNAAVAASMTGFRSDLGGRSVVLGADSSQTLTAGTAGTMTASSVTATAPGRLLRFYGQRSTATLGTGSSALVANAAVRSITTTLLSASRTLNGSGATGTDIITGGGSSSSIIHTVLLTESLPTKPTNCYTDVFSDSTSFAQNWVTTTRGTTSFTPAIINGRLRLTSNLGYISTAASLQRVFPTSNLIYVEFNYYSYPSASGADGVAVTLSDSNVTPQPGGFGGSLGYAPRDGSISGFAGGWVGIALDEYGNFSNPTEGRNGGPGFYADAVAVRGSGSGLSGYAYVAGTAANQNPGIDVATANVNTAGPGHRYRIVIDAAAAGQTYVTVDRDTGGTGNSYANLIPRFNLEASTGQATIPSNLTLSFTGSTGGSTNIHEIDSLSVCATGIQTVNQVDHFEFQYNTPGLTCEPASVTILACANAACTSYVQGTTTATLTPTTGWTGGNVVQLTNGSATVPLRQTTAGTAALSVASSTPAAKPFSQYKCNGTQVAANASCSLPFNDAGFAFDVPDVIANKPSGAVTIRAVKKSDSSAACAPLFTNANQNINFYSTYINPTSGTRPVELRAGSGSGSFAPIGGSTTNATSVLLTFNASGQAIFEARYQDAGVMNLTASYIGSGSNAGVQVSGSDQFVSRPAGICITARATASATNNSCAPTSGDYSNCNRFVRAGDNFLLRVVGMTWDSDTDPDVCIGSNIETPNYEQSDIALQSLLTAPVGGDAGSLLPVKGAITAASKDISIVESEVGVFRFRGTPPAVSDTSPGYFGYTIPANTSTDIGRFYPAKFSVLSPLPRIRNALTCSFTYRGQPFGFDTTGGANDSPALTVTALNLSDAVTNNYDLGGFWKLATPPAFTTPSSPPPDSAYSDPDATQNTLLRVIRDASPAPSVSVTGVNDKDGKRVYQFLNELFSYIKIATPGASDGAFKPTLNLVFPADRFTDSDGVCYGLPCSSYSITGIKARDGQPDVEIRYGRLRLDSVSGPADQPLAVPVTAEYFDGTRFVTNTADNCTVINGSGVTPTGYTDYLSAAYTSASGSATLANGTSLTALLMSAPGFSHEGSVNLLLALTTATNIAPWLQFDWDGNPSTANTGPTATASFGTYRGSDRVIFWQETSAN